MSICKIKAIVSQDSYDNHSSQSFSKPPIRKFGSKLTLCSGHCLAVFAQGRHNT